MEGLYLYCIREKTDTHCFSTKGIDGREEVFVIPLQELEAVVSNVPIEEFASEEIQKKAKEDLSWIKERAFAHEKVIEEAMGKDDKVLSLIPMGFGTIFKGKARLEEALNKDYLRIREVLDRIRGNWEWSVKVYLTDREKFVQVIDKSEAIEKKKEEIASLPEGMAFFMEEELKEVISREMKKELDSTAEVFFECLKRQAVDATKCKILEKELTGRREPMVLNAAYLISEEKIEDFKKAAETLNQQTQANGFCLEYSGPWPAYNFTSY